MEAADVVDDLVKEFLVFRGFFGTLHTFNAERKLDRTKGFDSQRAVDHFFTQVETYNVDAFLTALSFFEESVFPRLEGDYTAAIYRLVNSLKKYYVVHAIQDGKPFQATQFFERCGNELIVQADWQPWFAIPYLPNPEKQPFFRTFFAKDWIAALRRSLYSFFATVFQEITPPAVLDFATEMKERERLEEETQTKRSELRQSNSRIEALQAQIRGLESEISRLQRKKSGGSVSPTEAGPGSPQGHPRGVSSTVPRLAQASPGTSSPALASSSTRVVGGAPMTSAGANALNFVTSVAAAGIEAPVSQPSAESTSSPPSPSGTGTNASGVVGRDEEGSFTVAVTRTWQGPVNAKISRVRCSSRGHAAVALSDSTVAVFDVDSEHSKENYAPFSVEGDVRALEWLSVGQSHFVCAGSSRGVVRVWNLDAGTKPSSWKVDGDFRSVRDIACGRASPLITAATAGPGGGGIMYFRDQKYLKVIRKIEEAFVFRSIDFTADDTGIITGCSDGKIRLFDMREFSSRASLEFDGHERAVECVCWLAQHPGFAASAGLDGNLHRWSLRSPSRPLCTVDIPGFEGEVLDNPPALDLVSIGLPTHCLISSERAQACLFDLNSGRLVRRIGGYGSGGVLGVSGKGAVVSACSWWSAGGVALTGTNRGEVVMNWLQK